MSTSKPTILIVHGGWHTPASYINLTTALQAADYEVHCPRMLSVNGARPPNSSLGADADLIRSYATSLVEAGRTVVAIMHSYGGQVGTNALHGLGLKARSKEGKKGGVAHLVYMAAYAMPEGKALIEKVEEFGQGALMDVVFDFSDDRTVLHRDLSQRPLLLLGPGVDEADAKAYCDKLVLWNGQVMYEPLSHCAWREIPSTYIMCTQDYTVPHEYQKSFVEGMRKDGVEVETVELDTGHCPHFTKTEEMVMVVDGVVGGH